jgi:hypothetical protein
MFAQVPTEQFSVEDKVMFNVAKLTLMSKTIMQLRSYCAGSYPFVSNKSYHQLLCSLQVCVLFELNTVALNSLQSRCLFCCYIRAQLSLTSDSLQVMGEEECYRRSKQYEAPAN